MAHASFIGQSVTPINGIVDAGGNQRFTCVFDAYFSSGRVARGRILEVTVLVQARTQNQVKLAIGNLVAAEVLRLDAIDQTPLPVDYGFTQAIGVLPIRYDAFIGPPTAIATIDTPTPDSSPPHNL